MFCTAKAKKGLDNLIHLGKLLSISFTRSIYFSFFFKVTFSSKSPQVQSIVQKRNLLVNHQHTVNSRLYGNKLQSPAKINYRRLMEINSRYYGLSLSRTLTRGVRNKGVDCIKSGFVRPYTGCKYQICLHNFDYKTAAWLSIAYNCVSAFL